MLTALNNVRFGYQGEVLFEGVNLNINEGERIGLIGGNGEGKTTLLKLILGELTPDEGDIFIKNGVRMGYLAQTGGFDSEKTVFEEMRSIFTREQNAIESLREIERKIAQLSENDKEFTALSAKYEHLNKTIAATDGYNYEVRIKTVLNGMGFEKDYGQIIHTMSGGEKTKLKFCKLLLEQPELLVLDEPTNHLDVKTLFWLEEYLSSYKGALLIVSHDRYFLDKTVQKIAELENKKLQEFKGNYSKYKILKAERVATQWKEYEKQQEQIAHMQEYVERNLARASTTKMAQSRRTALEKMERIEKPSTPTPPPRFNFTYNEKPYENVLKIQDLTLSVGEKLLFENANAEVRRGEKCALVGDNGTGKSTLIRQIVKNAKREIVLGRFARIAYYDQENTNLNPDNTVLSELWGRHVLSSQTDVRAALARAGLNYEDVDKKVGSLSGGERAKLALAVFEAEHGNFLVLDEPTNHLDLMARESLEEALKSFDGTILFVSHDRYFIRSIADKILCLSGQGMQEFKGSYEEFIAWKNTAVENKNTAPMPENNAKNNDSFRSKKERADEAKKRQRMREIEKEITLLEDKQQVLSDTLSLPEVTGDYQRLQKTCEEIEQIKNRIDALYEEYEDMI